MKFEVVTPIDGFEQEQEFELSKFDDFFYSIKGTKTGQTIKLMSFGALKSLEFELPEEFISKLQIKSIENISIFYIFVLQTQQSDSSMNIFAPLIMNNKSMKMGQVHLNLNELGLDSLNDLLPKF